MKRKIILGLFAFFLFVPIANTVSGCIISYPSVVSVQADYEDLLEPIHVGHTVFVNIQIGYSVTVPNRLLDGGFLARLWVFKGLIVPPMKIHLEEKNIPDGITIGVITPDVYISDFSNNFVYSSTVLVITPNQCAQPGSYYVDIKGESLPIGRILASSYTERIFFSVEES